MSTQEGFDKQFYVLFRLNHNYDSVQEKIYTAELVSVFTDIKFL